METIKTVKTAEVGTITALSISEVFRNNIRQYAMLIALVAELIIFEIATGGILLLPMNVTNLLLQNSYVLILAIGMILCLLAGGHIDLSVGSLCAFVGAVVGWLGISNNMNIWLAIGITLLVGVVIGIWHGFWIAYVRIPSFIVTLAGKLLFAGLTMVILFGGITLAPFPESFQQISAGFIPDYLDIGIGLNMTALVVGIVGSVIYIIMELRKRRERRKYSFEVTSLPLFIAQLVLVVFAINLFTFWLAAYEGIPIIVAIIGIMIIGYTIFATKTPTGRYIYAMGGNEKAAMLSGVKTNKILFGVYVNMAVLATVAGISAASRFNAASPLAGQNYELDAIAACFIGGASAYGGIGTVIGSIIGALFMGILNNAMSILGWGTDMQLTIKGLVLLAAVAFDVISKKKSQT